MGNAYYDIYAVVLECYLHDDFQPAGIVLDGITKCLYPL